MPEMHHEGLTGLGPHGVISHGEINATLIVLAFGLLAMMWMAFCTRNQRA